MLRIRQAEWPELFQGLRTMEIAALPLLNAPTAPG